jgi:ABC-2 type transport system ATP-binding protein
MEEKARFSGSIIRVENLVKRFGDITAVDGISFEVREGAIFGFLGPNGAGKTTTINVLCTLLGPTSGSAYINGHDCMKEPARVRESIGLVFQDTTLDKDLTAYENLVFHAYLYSVRKAEIKERVEDALRFIGLYDRKDDLVKKYSGGMKRRLEVARGLIHRPRVLFLDEPTLGLDPQSRTNLWESIAKLPAKHNVTVFMTTHYMEEAEVCDNIAIIDKGRIIAEGSPEELKKIVGGDVIYLRTTDNEKSMEILKDTLGLDSSLKDGELYITAQKGEACIPELIRALADMVVSVRLQRPTLNDVFLNLTGKAIRDEEVSGADTIRGEVRAYRRRHGA